MSKIFAFIKKYDILILIILGFLLYFPSLFYDFVFDDFSYTINNQYINGIISVKFFDFFIPKFISDNIYAPLTFIVTWLIIKLFGISSFALHFVNVIFYILSSIVLYYLLKKIIKNDLISFFATVLYIIHPCHIENTAWISAMGYNIASLFFFLSFLYFILVFDEDKKFNYVYSVIFYVLAILSQPIAVTLPVILFLWVYFLRKERLKESIIYISGYIPFLFIYLYLYRETILQTERFISVKYTILEKLSILGFDIFNSFIPIHLCPIQPKPNLFYIISFIIFILLFVYFRKNKILLFFVVFYIISLLPYSNIFLDIRVPVAERYLLLSSVSSCVLISYLSFYFFEKFKHRNLLKYLVFLFFISLYSLCFVFYIPVWENDKKLWSYSYNINPNNLTCSETYALILLEEGRYDESLFLANKIIEKYPNFLVGYQVKIKSLIAKGYIVDAKKLGLEILEFFDSNYEVYLSLFDISILLQDYDEALKFLEKANIIIKNNGIYKNGDIYFLAKRYIIISYMNVEIEKFIENFKIISNDFRLLQNADELLKILEDIDYKSKEELCLNYLKRYNDENYSRYVVMLLNCFYIKETYKENASEMMRSLLKDMNKTQEFINKGDISSAEKMYLDIISKNKYMYEAYYKLGILYLQTNRIEEAKKIFSKILYINPNDKQIKQIYNSL